ncbi:MAG: restriction endonuclease subunit S [Castellaniella sp.]|uniref:restriction endonuclease subunit S n=1 Tax=Castellaniella sp. TaxID=1955812 RepID=UPI003C734AE8
MTQIYQFSEVCEITMGQAPAGESYNTDGIGLPLIAGAGDFGDLHPAPKKFTTEVTRKCRKDDIVLGIRASIGEKVWADKDYCLGRGVAGLRPRKGVDRNYLWHWLTQINPELLSRAKGATFKQVNKDDVGSLKIILPTFDEQCRIATILDKAESLRMKRREAIVELDKLAQAIFIEMFGDPVTNSKGLPLSKLGDIGTLERGISKHRPRNDPALLGGRYPLIQTGDVAQSEGRIRTYNQTYSELGLKQSRLWPKGTLCITIAANIAKTGTLEFDACFPDSIVGFSAREPATVIYVKAWMEFLQKTIERNAPESAQKNINLEILRNLDVPYPSIEAQKEFANRIAKINSQQQLFEKAVSEAEFFFKSLQNKAFSREF